jgi:hypothetical protein
MTFDLEFFFAAIVVAHFSHHLPFFFHLTLALQVYDDLFVEQMLLTLLSMASQTLWCG